VSYRRPYVPARIFLASEVSVFGVRRSRTSRRRPGRVGGASPGRGEPLPASWRVTVFIKNSSVTTVGGAVAFWCHPQCRAGRL